MPGSSPTMARRDPTSLLNSVDLPTFGRPTIAMRGDVGMSSESSSSARPDGRSPQPAQTGGYGDPGEGAHTRPVPNATVTNYYRDFVTPTSQSMASTSLQGLPSLHN